MISRASELLAGPSNSTVRDQTETVQLIGVNRLKNEGTSKQREFTGLGIKLKLPT